MAEKRQKGPPILRGGAEATKQLRRFEMRNVIQTAHGDGTVRIWDAGHADMLENSASLQVDLARSVGRFENIDITVLSMSGATGELAVGLAAGEVVIYRWGINSSYERENDQAITIRQGGITNITSRSEPSLKEGLQPFILYDMSQGPISALKISDVGFVGIGSESGTFSIIDLRGPAVIFTTSLSELFKQEKKGGLFSKSHSRNQSTATRDYTVIIEFGVMTLEGDEYSSICCFLGTNLGHVATLKILPQADGRYTAQFVGSTQLSDRIIAINPIHSSSGAPASATGNVVAGLREGLQVHGTLVVVTLSEVRIFKPALTKGAQKSWDEHIGRCSAACVAHFDLHGYALVSVFSDGTTRGYSLPALKEIGSTRLDMLDKSRISSSIVTPSGDILGWSSPSEIALLNVWGTGLPLPSSQDQLYNFECVIPSRPTISNLQWISGTQYMSPLDLDLLIGGPDRPPSKRMMAAAAEEERQARLGQSNSRAGSSNPASQEGWGEYMTRQLNERTEKLNLMVDGMSRVEENSAGWADDAQKFVSRQKRNIIMKGVTGRFF